MSTPTGKPAKELLQQAQEKSRQYEWMAASQLYQRILDTAGSNLDAAEAARLTDLSAKCLFKGAFQAKNRDEFKRRMIPAQEAYEKAASLHEASGATLAAKRERAKSRFASFWITDDQAERKAIIEQCVEQARETAQSLGQKEDRRFSAEAQGDLLAYLLEAIPLTTEWTKLASQIDEIIKVCQSAADGFESLGENEKALESLCQTQPILATGAWMTVDPPRIHEISDTLQKLRKRIAEISVKVDTPYAHCLVNEAAAWVTAAYEGNMESALTICEAAIPHAERLKDSLILGRIYMVTMLAAFWTATSAIEMETEAKRQLSMKGIQLAPLAIENLEIPLHGAFLSAAYEFYAECYTNLSDNVETDKDKKKENYLKAMEIARKGMAYDKQQPGSAHALSKAQAAMAKMLAEPAEKARLLKEALSIREQTIRASDLLAPYSWDRGVMYSHIAAIKSSLAELETDGNLKIECLKSAVADKQLSVELCANRATTPPYLIVLSSYEEQYGDILTQLYRLTRKADVEQLAIKAYLDAIQHAEKSGHIGPIAPLRWKTAKAYDDIGDYAEAAANFSKAAESYRLLVQKIPSCCYSAFDETAAYMDAWTEIMRARLNHNEEEYSSAAENYMEAASILQATGAKHYPGFQIISKHYVACSFLEKGEALSKHEKEDLAVESFSAALTTLQETRAGLENRLNATLESEEKHELEYWLQVTKNKEKYCLGRIPLEEAKLLDKKGEKLASSSKYHQASESLRSLLSQPHAEQDRVELQTLILFCDAWSKMKDAEAKGSPSLYSEAARIFLEARDSASREKTRLLAVANASICKALKLGTRWRLTRDAQLYSGIKQRLDISADCYAEAGFQSASEWTRATQRMFDALAYLTSAETEPDHKKKTELYHLAEKHLDLAAKLYEHAGYPVKRDEALRHRQSAREEKELLLTPVDALASNPAVSRVTVTPVSLTDDEALGLQKLEAARVVGSLTIPKKELQVGSELTCDLEIANVGRTEATLIKLEELAPESFQPDLEKSPYPIEGSTIDLRAKRLEYLKTHRLKVTLKATQKGEFQLQPRILFLDENGSYRSYVFDAASVSVKELGISGWIKGPSK